MLDLYKNIKERRLQLGLTQSDLAELLGYADKSMIAKIENGKIDLPHSKIFEFAKALKINAPDLMGYTEPEEDDLSFLMDIKDDSELIKYARIVYNMRPEERRSVYDFIDFMSKKQ